MRTKIEDIVYYLPEKIVTNDQLQAENPDWDMKNLYDYGGVRQRHIAADDETALDLAEKACRLLFDKNPSLFDQVDSILFCTQCPDHILPSNSCILHGRLEMEGCVAAVDINMSCSGYLYGLYLAGALINSGSAKNVLLVTADTYSKYIHPQDRSTRILFADGAAVTWLTGSNTSQGIIDLECGTSGKNYDATMLRAGGARLPCSVETAKTYEDNSGNIKSDNHLYLSGIHILLFVKSKVPAQVKHLLEKNGYEKTDIDKYIFHQGSKGILDALGKLLDLPNEKIANCLEDVGNTISSSIPISLAREIEENKVKRGDTLLLSSYGAGMSWGIAIVEY